MLPQGMPVSNDRDGPAATLDQPKASILNADGVRGMSAWASGYLLGAIAQIIAGPRNRRYSIPDMPANGGLDGGSVAEFPITQSAANIREITPDGGVSVMPSGLTAVRSVDFDRSSQRYAWEFSGGQRVPHARRKPIRMRRTAPTRATPLITAPVMTCMGRNMNRTSWSPAGIRTPRKTPSAR